VVVLLVSQLVLDMRNGLDRNRCHLLSTVYHAFSCHVRIHRGISVFHGVDVRGRIFLGKIHCFAVSERCVFEFLGIFIINL